MAVAPVVKASVKTILATVEFTMELAPVMYVRIASVYLLVYVEVELS